MIHSSLLALILRLSPPHVINVSPQVLLESFEASMHVLEDLTEKNQRRVDKLEHGRQEGGGAQEQDQRSGLHLLSEWSLVSICLGGEEDFHFA